MMFSTLTSTIGKEWSRLDLDSLNREATANHSAFYRSVRSTLHGITFNALPCTLSSVAKRSLSGDECLMSGFIAGAVITAGLSLQSIAILGAVIVNGISNAVPPVVDVTAITTVVAVGCRCCFGRRRCGRVITITITCRDGRCCGYFANH